MTEVAPGIQLSEIAPGGRQGPNGEVLLPTRGGQVWLESWLLGSDADPFRLNIPDVRMPANQYWPMHWHDCWIAVIVLDGECLIGDTWLEPGDVLITPAGLEYGPLVSGPTGCQLFEIFARDHLSLGGYGPEYHDHPTLQDTGVDGASMFQFLPRSAENERNRPNETLPLAADPRLVLGRLGAGDRWALGEPDDPDRGLIDDVLLGPGEEYPGRNSDEWRALILLNGTASFGDRPLAERSVLIVAPGSTLPRIQADTSGAHLLEVTRSAAGAA
jgi:hypothetical protein